MGPRASTMTFDRRMHQPSILGVDYDGDDEDEDYERLTFFQRLRRTTVKPSNPYYRRFTDILNFLGVVSCFLIIYDVSISIF